MEQYYETPHLPDHAITRGATLVAEGMMGLSVNDARRILEEAMIIINRETLVGADAVRFQQACAALRGDSAETE